MSAQITELQDQLAQALQKVAELELSQQELSEQLRLKDVLSHEERTGKPETSFFERLKRDNIDDFKIEDLVVPCQIELHPAHNAATSSAAV